MSVSSSLQKKKHIRNNTGISTHFIISEDRLAAHKGLNHFFSHNLIAIAEKLHYSQENIAILKGDLETLKNSYPHYYENILSCTHHRDSRTPIAYAQDIVASWLIEDFILQKFTNLGYDVQLYGADKNREILKNSKTSAESDFIFKQGGREIIVELMNDYTGFWDRSEKLHLRDNKYKKLQKTGALLLAVCMQTKRYTLLDMRNDDVARYIPYHKPYGKPAYEIQLDAHGLKPFLVKDIAQDIIQHF